MSKTRVDIVQDALQRYLSGASTRSSLLGRDQTLHAQTTLTVGRALEVFEDQVLSRLLDVESRELRKTNQSFYTISSAGHEQNAVVGSLLRLDDPCFLHYRSGGLMMSRARQLPGSNPALDTMLSFCASADDPIAQGRHKVWGSRPLWVPPQTSTIASHLPKAAGFAAVLRHARRMGKAAEMRDDSIVLCSFGDASANHAAALAGVNSARYSVRRGGAAPIVFLCEDNGIGISVETPRDWIRDNFSVLPHLTYFETGGTMDDVWNSASAAIDYCRRKRTPVFLHLHVVRLWGHAGTDVETAYRTLADIESAEAEDPLLANARLLVDSGAATPQDLLSLIDRVGRTVREASAEAIRRPKLKTVDEVTWPLAPYSEPAIRKSAETPLNSAERLQLFQGALPEDATAPPRRTMGSHINSALTDEMLRCPEIIVFGEDVGRKGGVYYVTAGLQKRFGPSRCFDTLLDETSILGVAQGAGMAGLLPIPEIQYVAYIHNALDQIRGEASSLQFFSSGQFSNPMVVRVQGLAYQKGFGGHFHNDNSIGALRDIPGLIVGVPARGDDAAMMLRGLVHTARACGRVAVFLEPIALYHEKDLHEEGDQQWLFDYPPPDRSLLPGEVQVYHADATDLLIVSYANGLRLSLRAAKVLREQHGIRSRVLDLRWLNPLPVEAILEHAGKCGNVLVADECRKTGGGIADATVALLAEAGYSGRLRSVRAVDTFIPLGPAANLVLISDQQIVQTALAMLD